MKTTAPRFSPALSPLHRQVPPSWVQDDCSDSILHILSDSEGKTQALASALLGKTSLGLIGSDQSRGLFPGRERPHTHTCSPLVKSLRGQIPERNLPKTVMEAREANNKYLPLEGLYFPLLPYLGLALPCGILGDGMASQSRYFRASSLRPWCLPPCPVSQPLSLWFPSSFTVTVWEHLHTDALLF